MKISHNVVGWFEIPVTDMERAIKFYETVFGFELRHEKMGPLDTAHFPRIAESMGSCGSLVYHPEEYKPSADGVVIYFTDFSGDLNNELAKVEAAGGKVLLQKTLIRPDIGYMGILLDTEGNKIGIHSRE